MSELDLVAYLSRVGRPAPVPAGLESLQRLHEAHLAAIAFENVDVRLGRPILLDVPALEEKLVRRRRGGYCFEQNTLFAAALRALGFGVATLEARVRPPGAPGPLPRTHMVLAVEVAGRRWLADVGFGGDGPLWPVPLDGEVTEQPGGDYAIAREEGDVHVLRLREAAGWRDLYAFRLEPALPVDFVVASHFTSTWPASPFVRTLTLQRTTAAARFVLRGRVYGETRGGATTSRQVDDAEVVALAAEVFGLELSEDELRQALGPLEVAAP